MNHPTQSNIPPQPHLPHWVSILIIVILGLFVIGVVGYAAYQYFVVEPAPSTPQPLPQLPQPTDPTANWQTYRNEEYGFEVKYPENWEYRDFRVYQDDLKKKTGSINFFDPDNEYEIIRGSQAKKWKLVINVPLPEMGLESMELLETKEVEISGSNKKLVSKTYKPREPAEEGDKYLIEASYFNEYKDSVLLRIFSTEDEFDYNKKLFNQILSTFKFIE